MADSRTVRVSIETLFIGAFMVVVAAVVLWLFALKWWKSRDLGEACCQDVHCDELCLRPPRGVATAAHSGGECGRLDTPGVCTARCEADADCPVGMLCGEGEWTGGLVRPMEEYRYTRVCVPGAWSLGR